ncbi:MAG TPA: efflux RND transporter permease subunit, partial [Gemmataceae bacterium]
EGSGGVGSVTDDVRGGTAWAGRDGGRFGGCSVHSVSIPSCRTEGHYPIDGRIGRRAIDPGNLVKADETILATLVSRDPMYVYFDVDERSVLRLLRLARSDKGKAEKMPAAIGLAAEEDFPHRGVVDLTDNQVNPETGTLRMRAVLPNKDGLLMPGLFVRVRLAMGAPRKALTVPEQAVMVEGGEKFVYVVNDKDVIERRAIAVGQADKGWRVVTYGLKADERVVVGQLPALRPGIRVRPRAEDKPAPKPKQSSNSGPVSPAPSARGPGGLGILVETVYPGANAQVVSDVIRSPIEQQINGVEKLRLMRSRCTSDGKYALTLAFGRGVDLKVMQVLVQNRVNLAMPTLPDMVKNAGVSVKRGSSGALAIVNLSSPDDKYDSIYLSNYASIQIKDELSHLPGVGDVTLLGQSDYRVRVWLDPDRLAALGLNAGDVTRTIEKQKEVGGLDVEELSNLILKADGEGRVVRLKDVANLELGAGPDRSRASFNGKPVSALVVRPDGETASWKVRAALRDRLSQLRERLPKGLDLVTAFDFPTDTEHLLLDLDLPAAVSPERVNKVLSRCEALPREVPGVRDVLAMSENPFDLFGGGPCILIALMPAKNRKAGRDEIARAIRAKFDEFSVRVRDLSAPGRPSHFGYPLDLAVRGPELERVREFAKELAGRLRENKKLSDVWANPDSTPRLQRTVDIDRTAAATRGVSLDDIFATLRVQGGSMYVNDFNRFGRTWRVQVQADPGSGDWIKDLGKLKVRGARGQMIPLNVLVKVSQTEAPRALDFLDFFPMIEITANPASGVKLEEARKLCEKLAEEVRKELQLPADYRLFWLQDPL